ncbi:MAG: alcohol dehydrogenase catalytic domain-containing protein [Methanomassiliicoccales archaeon]|nr:MAG: alcohol dehydrogenase catalytic domain-containing protein [Methanomassiliicoccales archaeon]
MRVAMYYNNEDVRLEEMEKPQIEAGEILIRVEASGICGSDVMFWYRKDKVPLVLGHEIAGEIVEVGEGVEKFTVGHRVVATHHVPCNTCHYCQMGNETACETLQRRTHFYPGGFAEFVRIPAINVDRGVFPIPEGVSFEEATFTEPLACVVRGQKKANLQPAQSVFVVGCGISGLLHINLASGLGAGRVIAADTIEYRMKAAKRLGAEHVLKYDDDLPSKVREINDGILADLVIICRGAFIPEALNSVEKGGTVLFFGGAKEHDKIPQTVNELFWRTEMTLTSSYAGGPADCINALELVRAGRVNVKDMITHRYGLAEAQKGFYLVSHPWEQESIKVVIEPQK